MQESTAAPAETESETETATVEEDVPPEEGMVKSDLTGEWISGDLADQRPIAVMIPDENARSRTTGFPMLISCMNAA